MAADPYADLAAKYGIGTEPADPDAPAPKSKTYVDYDDLATKYGVAAAPEPPPAVDMSAASRRAAGGRPAGPRELTDEQAGVESGPVAMVGPTGKANTAPGSIGPGLFSEQQTQGPNAPPANDYVTARPSPGGGTTIRAQGGNPNEMADPVVQMGTAAAMGRGVGAGAALVPGIGAAVAPAIEGGIANKAMGGDFTTGAVLAGAVPFARAATGAASEAVPAIGKALGSAERVKARQLRNLTEDAPSRQAKKVAQVAGPEGQALEDVVARNDDLRHALAVHAKDRPAAALTAVSETKNAANAARNADFEAMQNYWADKPASAQASIPQMLDDYKALAKTNLGDRERQAVLKRAHEELVRFGDDLREAQGLPPAVNGDYSGTIVSPKDLRAFEQTIGSQAFEKVSPQGLGAVKARVNAELYKPLAKQMNALAENTPGVDAKRFATRGQDIHVLIPVEESLKARVEQAAHGRASLIEMAKRSANLIAGGAAAVTGGALGSPALAVAGAAAPIAAKAMARLGRGIDYRLAEAQLRRVKAAQVARAPAARPAPAMSPASVGVAAGQTERRPGLADLYLNPAQ